MRPSGRSAAVIVWGGCVVVCDRLEGSHIFVLVSIQVTMESILIVVTFFEVQGNEMMSFVGGMDSLFTS
jgi:hypothetical protein